MNKFIGICLVLLAGIGIGAGLSWFLVGESGVGMVTGDKAMEKKVAYWVAPMDAGYRRDEPGKSPMGMALIPVYESDGDDEPGTVTISANIENNLGVQLGKADRSDLSLKINTVGFIQFNEKTVSHAHSRVEGWIESLSVNAVGDPVEKGQKLFELYSPELVNAQEEYLLALQTKNRQLTRSAGRKLTALGVSNQQVKALKRTKKVEQRLPIYAHGSGYVATLNVREGMFIKPATKILSIGGLDDVWVIAEIFERQASWVKSGQRVRMVTESAPGAEWLGVVDYIYPVLDQRTRTLRARIVFDNADQRLKPNMFAQLTIDAGTRNNVLSIPRDAVIRQGGMIRVVKALGDGKFRSVRIETGIESGNRIEVVAGLTVEDEVVISSQFLIDSESSVDADLRRIDGVGVMNNVVKGIETEVPMAEAMVVSDVSSKGTVVSIMPGHGMVKIQHTAVPEWDWPAMTMDFTVNDDVDLSPFNTGDRIAFHMNKLDDGSYRISQIEAYSDDSKAIDHSADQH